MLVLLHHLALARWKVRKQIVSFVRLNAIPTPVLMHFLFLYFRFFITYFPFLIKNLVFPSLTSKIILRRLPCLRFTVGKREQNVSKELEKQETFLCYLLKRRSFTRMWQQVEQFFIHAAVLWIITTNFISSNYSNKCKNFVHTLSHIWLSAFIWIHFRRVKIWGEGETISNIFRHGVYNISLHGIGAREQSHHIAA